MRARTLAVAIVVLALAAYLGRHFWTPGQEPARAPGILAYLEPELTSPGTGTAASSPTPARRFDAEQFRNPGVAFRPWTRWWWPGNDVEPAELRREIEMFASKGFGGVEIQSFGFGLPRDLPPEQVARILSFDSARYYRNLQVALATAREVGIGVDLTAGAGWPTASPAVELGDGLLGLTHSKFQVDGGREVRIPLDPPGGDLQAVVAARILREHGSDPDRPVTLDPSDLRVLDGFVDDDLELVWTPPAGRWQIVALWSAPTGQTPIAYPAARAAYIVNHFDRERVRANYDYLFGARTGLSSFFGGPLRAIFNDSFEFTTGRHFSEDFLEEFRARRGYDLRPFLPAILALGYNNAHIRPAHKRRPFWLRGVNERVMYDYDRTVSDLFIERFVIATADWAHQRGLVSRLQPYGIIFDVIRAAGEADIPEAEQAFAGGSELFLKLISSGALLANRPLVSAEALVFQGQDYMITPQKAKLAIDTLFAAGVNHVVYHGTPYRYPIGDTGALWNPWSSPASPRLAFSTVVAESDNFWRYQKQFNDYVARVQYALRLGRPTADVLIYYPYLGVVPRKLAGPGLDLARKQQPAKHLPHSSREAWLDANREIVLALENHGVRWAWVNDAALQSATARDAALEIESHRYQAVLLANVESMPPETAERLRVLADAQVPVVTHGNTPVRQPGYLDAVENDRRVREALGAIQQMPGYSSFDTAPALAAHLAHLSKGIVIARPQLMLRHLRVTLPDGGEMLFLRNRWHGDLPARLAVPEYFTACYWLDPVSGEIQSASLSETSVVSRNLSSFGSVLFYCTLRHPLPMPVLKAPAGPGPSEGTGPVNMLEHWDLEVERSWGAPIRRTGTSLFDWRNDAELKLNGTAGSYETTWQLSESEPGARYLLDLGRVEATAEVEVNGRRFPPLLFAPYRIDISNAVQVGENRLRIMVIPPTRNGMLDRAERGEPAFAHLRGRTNSALPAGLLGPVTIETD